MAGRRSETSKVSIYRLTPPESGDLKDCVLGKYYEREFLARPVSIMSRKALLVYGTMINERPIWLDHVRSLIDVELGLRNDTAASVLLISHDQYIYALSWGMGHLIIDPARLDSAFGLRFAVRRANPEQVRSITTHAMDTLPRIARTSVPGGANLDAFGMEEIGEVISRLVGRISASGFSASKPDREVEITIRGADALALPVGRTPGALLKDLDVIDRIVESEDPVAGLEHLENTQPLKPQNPLISRLNEELAEALGGQEARLALCWPAEWEEDRGEASYYGLSGIGPGWNRAIDELELEDILESLVDTSRDKRLKKLKLMKILALDDSKSPIGRQISADRWLTFEKDLEGQKYVFYSGKWYNIGGAYLDMLAVKVAKILNRRFSYNLPSWPLMEKKRKKTGKTYLDLIHERTYNEYVAKRALGFVRLDRRLIKTRQHPRGFEACDLLGPNDELIHVKRLEDSVSASHLFNQALVSSEALRWQADAIDGLREMIAKATDGRRTIPDDFRPRIVVLAFGDHAVGPDHLFTFSQVSLGRCADRLGELDISLRVADIESSTEKLEDIVSQSDH